MCIIIYKILRVRDFLKSPRFGFFTLAINIIFGVFSSRNPWDSENGFEMWIFHFGLDQKLPRDRGFLKIGEFLLNPGDFSEMGFFSWDGIFNQKATSAWDLVPMRLGVFSLGFPGKKPPQKYLILTYSEFLDLKTLIHFSAGTLVSFVFLGRIWRVVWGLESSHGDWVPCWRRRHWNWISQLGTRDSLLFWILTLEKSSKFKW